jgi:hypothetical protein
MTVLRSAVASSLLVLASLSTARADDAPPPLPPPTATPAPTPPPPVAPVSAAAPDESQLGAPGESCRARADCKSGLQCIEGACRDPHEGQACGATPDCGGVLRCVDHVCRSQATYAAPPPTGAPGGEPKEDEPAPWRSQRIGIYYLMTPPLAGNLKSLETGHSVGIEGTSRLFAELRMRSSFGYQAAPGLGTVVHGFRAEFMSLGYLFEVAHTKAVRFGVEPWINTVNLETYFYPNGRGSSYVFSSGWSVAAILGFGDSHGYLSVEPVGMDLRWLVAGDGFQTQADLGMQWRLRVSVGLSF